jgi:hypothetical protein
MQEEKGAAERKQRLARAEAKKAAAEAAKKVGSLFYRVCRWHSCCWVLCSSAAIGMQQQLLAGKCYHVTCGSRL